MAKSRKEDPPPSTPARVVLTKFRPSRSKARCKESDRVANRPQRRAGSGRTEHHCSGTSYPTLRRRKLRDRDDDPVSAGREPRRLDRKIVRRRRTSRHADDRSTILTRLVRVTEFGRIADVQPIEHG